MPHAYTALLVVVEVAVVAEDHLVRRVLVLGEGVVLAQVVEGGGHRAVLVLERELALVRVRVRVRVGVRVRARARVRDRGRDRVRGRGRGGVRVRVGLTLSLSPGMAATTTCPPLGEVG